MKNKTVVGGRLLRRLFWTIFNFLVLAFIVAGAVALGVFYYYGSGLPNYQELKNYKPAVITRLYSSDGRLFAEYAAQKRIYVPINAIPKKVLNAFLAAEDKTFYTHFGLDLAGIARAAVSNLSRLGQSRRPAGASTSCSLKFPTRSPLNARLRKPFWPFALKMPIPKITF